MTSPIRSIGTSKRSVVGATVAFGIVVCWTEIMFGVPTSLVPSEPSLLWFVGATAVCASAALVSARFRWVTVVAVPAAAAFAAICALMLVSRCKEPEVIHPLQPYTYGMATFVALCGLAPTCLLLGVTFARMDMRRTWCASLTLALWTAPLWILTSLNVVDYAMFRWALHRLNGLGREQIVAIADRVRDVKEPRRYAHGDWPVEFAPLKPKVVQVAPGYSYVSLYERGEIYLELAIVTEERSQSAFFFTNCDGPQKEVHLWRNPPATTTVIRPQPLVTLHEYSMGWSRDWVVLPDRVQVIGTKSDDPRARTAMLAEAILSPTDIMKIATIVTDVKARIGGRAFMAPVADGLAVLVHFGSSDIPAPDDILLHNAWTAQAQPLFAAVCDRLPLEFQSDFARRIEDHGQDFGRLPIDVRRIAEIREEHPRLPWWCVWFDLLRPDSGYVSGRVGSTHIPDPLRYVYRD